ncbi:adenylate/guanylate cyclase domain-containing protein [Jiella marina]|uniref:adenylate/guanylate cyclase domain-containing protein n=1 Tax=Jiella sp. LLJ827 TaxID=2917712 RepID=UPI0021016379|nr:adenylate/guanylate cyclase domain-containing protein [Jiella sp. LLJ827]MCQ0989392.1 adenylate/guanylate cyclase domain-containing protein [Jiella sp. LLJ827]
MEEGTTVSSKRALRAAALRRVWRSRLPPALLDVGRWRQVSGLILFAYAAMHLANHALGNLSLSAMQAGAAFKGALWGNPIGFTLLYGSLLVHVVLAVAGVWQRRNWKLPALQTIQIAAGLAIPLLLFPHIVATRGADVLWGNDVGYRELLALVWPGGAVLQTLLLTIVWLHGCLGVHMWLKGRSWFDRTAPFLACLATALVVFAFTGFVSGGRAVLPNPPMPLGAAADIVQAADSMRAGAAMALTLLIAAIILRPVVGRRNRVLVAYDGLDRSRRVVTAMKGASVLEASRSAAIPHASACGGRGRCSTCRILVLKGHDREKDAPGLTEARLLAKIGAPPDVRLACQYHPSGNVTVRQLVGAGEIYDRSILGDSSRFGVERETAVLFADLRGFTGIAERLLPYDVVHLLNAYFDRAARAIETHGGEVDKFMGDGLMAVFSVGSIEKASRDAADAALAILEIVDEMNARVGKEVGSPLRVAVGLHAGTAIFGRIGGGSQRGQLARTALGRTVNTAARLQDFAKENDVPLVVSRKLAKLGELDEPNGVRSTLATLRGTARPTSVLLFPETSLLRAALEPANQGDQRAIAEAG